MKQTPNTTRLFARITGLFVILFVVAAVSGVTLPRLFVAEAVSPPNVVPYQGRILNSNSVPISDSSVDMIFELYDSLAAGTCLWSNSSATCASATAMTVTLTNGLFSENLGDTSSGYAAISDSIFADDASVFLQVTIEGETLTPRKPIGAAPYALNAETLDGVDSTGFLASDGDTGTGAFDFTGAEFTGASPFRFEGATDDDVYSTFAFNDPSGANTITFQDGSGTVAFTSDISGTGLFTDGGAVTYLTATADDVAIGGTAVASSPFAIDESANTVYIGEGSNSDGAIIWKASDADTGTLTYSTSDQWEFTGGAINSDSTITASDFACTDCLDFTEIGDSLTLDATTQITASGGDDFILDLTAAGSRFDIEDSGSSFFRVGGDQSLYMESDLTTGNSAVQVIGDSLTDYDVVALQGHGITTGSVLGVASSGNARTTGDLFFVLGSGSRTATGSIGGNLATYTQNINNNSGGSLSLTGALLELHNNPVNVSGTLTDNQDGLYVNQDNSDNTGSALRVANTATGGNSLEVSASHTTGDVIFLSANSLTTGNVIEIDAGNFTDDTGRVIDIDITESSDDADVITIETNAVAANTVVFNIEADGDVTASDFICTDCLDFSDFADSMTLDASTQFQALSGNDLTIDLAASGSHFIIEDAGTTFFRITDGQQLIFSSDVSSSEAQAWSASAHSITDGVALSVAANGLTTGSVFEATTNGNARTSGEVFRLADISARTSTGTISGEILELVQQIDNDSGGLLTLNGALLSITNNPSNTSGTLTDTASLIDLTQSNNSSTGPLLTTTSTAAGAEVLDLNLTAPTSTADIINIDANQLSDDSARVIAIDINETTATADVIRLETDVGGANTEVFRIEADGEAFSGAGFTVSGTNYYGDAITSTGAFTYTAPTSFTWNDDGANTLMTLTDNGTTGTLAVTGNADITDDSAAFALDIFNDGNLDTRQGVSIQGCLDTNPTASCNLIEFRDGDGGIIGAVEGDGAGGVTNASSGSDYAELFPGTLSAFSVGDVIGLDASGNAVLATEATRVIGAYSFAPNTLGNWFEDWQQAGTHVPVALLGQVPVNVTMENGVIAVGDYLTLSNTTGSAMKADGVGYVVGRALESASSNDQIQVFIQPTWQAIGVLSDEQDQTLVSEGLVLGATGTANAVSPGVGSNGLTFRGSGWDGSSATARQMLVQNDVTDSSDYRLSITNDDGDEVAYISHDGDLALSGRLYPSDRGEMQTDKYIYYDGSAGFGGDFMRTNASGWGSGSYDFAEMFPSRDALSPGEVVVFSDDEVEVLRSTGRTYDPRVAGIVSTQPGFLAGENIEGHVPIALAGRVPTYVTNENGSIQPGDPLTTSSRSGYAMKATEPGPVVGYAMEAFDGTSGTITVFVRPSYYDGSPIHDAPGTENIASGLEGSISTFDATRVLDVSGGTIINLAALQSTGSMWEIRTDGSLRTKGRFVHVLSNNDGDDVEAYGVVSPQTTVQLSGTAQLTGGRARIKFEEIDPNFNDIIASDAPYRVFLTADRPSGPLYAFDRDQAGFLIRETGEGGNAIVDWMVIAYLEDFAPVDDTSVQSQETVVEGPIEPEEEEETPEDSEENQEGEENSEEAIEPEPETEAPPETETESEETQEETDPGQEEETVEEPPAEPEPEPEPEPEVPETEE